jgi:hypothetical protein
MGCGPAQPARTFRIETNHHCNDARISDQTSSRRGSDPVACSHFGERLSSRLPYEFADQCQSRFGGIRDHSMPARGKSFEADEMGRQGGCYVNLTLDRGHRILFAAHHERGTLHALKVGDQVEAVVFPTWPSEPLQYLCIANNSASDIRIAWRAGVERKCEAQPGVKGRSNIL